MAIEKRILVVDDDDAIRMLVSTVLRRRGFHVDSAHHGAEAVDVIARCRYSLIVLDLMMPRMSGYDVLDYLGTRPVSSRPLVLVLTAGIQSRTFDPSLVLGTIQKPFDIDLLIDTVAACLAAITGHEQSTDCPSIEETHPYQPDKPS
jgi:DNA-binding response OmpR family regulator